MIKKITIFGLIFMSFRLLDSVEEEVSFDQGKFRVLEIMRKGVEGIEAFNKKDKILFAESLNLALDLNLEELVARFDCRTILGREFLYQALQNPLSPKDRSGLLENRQDSISVLSKNDKVLFDLQDLLSQAAMHEKVIMDLMKSREVDMRRLSDAPFMEKIEKTSSLFQFYEQANSLAILGGMGYGVKQVYNVLPKYDYELYSNVVKQVADAASEFAGQDPLSAGILGAYSALMVGVIGYGFYKTYADYMDGLKTRDILRSMNRLIYIAEEIEDICKKNGILNQFAISQMQNGDSISLVNNLKSPIYSSDSNISPSPITRTFKYQVYEKDMHLAHIFASIAEMDALCAIADKIVQLRDQDNRFCFVQFIDGKEPMVQTHKFWNLLLDDSVANDFSEGRNVILTGPNAGGKTTAIRSILQNIVLAQTFGVAAAQDFAVTMFNKIHSYLNVSDDILQGKSLFASEVARAQQIMKVVKSLPSNELYFFALDELFTGTNVQDGEECAYNFIRNIGSYSNSQFVYATHFDRLKSMEADNYLRLVNYKIDTPAQDASGKFMRTSSGKLAYPFTMSLGVNHMSVAKEIAYDAGLFDPAVAA